MNTEIVDVPGLVQEDVGTLLNTRTYTQYCEMVRKMQVGECPFCQLDSNINKIISEIDDWRIWRNPFPHTNTAHHFVLAPTRHITHVNEMVAQDWLAVGKLTLNTVRRHDDVLALAGGGFAMRFGDPRLNAGSVRHLHANIMVPDGTGQVRITLAKDSEDTKLAWKRVRVFEKIRQGCAFEDLSIEERESIQGRLR